MVCMLKLRSQKKNELIGALERKVQGHRDSTRNLTDR